MEKPFLQILLLQYDPVWEDKEANQTKILNLIHHAQVPTDLIILPEMTLTGFSMNAETLAEDEKGPSCSFFSKLAYKYNTHLIIGLIRKFEGKIYNSLLHFDREGKIAAEYRKIHLFGLADENKNYTAGSDPVMTDICGWKTGLSICYDLRFPELYRYYGKQKADIMINIANWPVPRVHHWRHLAPARSIENLCYTVACNRTGTDPYVTYDGSSMVCAPTGEVIDCQTITEETLYYTINKQQIELAREKFPFLEDMVLVKE